MAPTIWKQLTEKQQEAAIHKACRKLPNRLWSLLKTALDDLRRIERLRKYEVQMGSWIEFSPGGVCEVCLAGAAVAMRTRGLGIDLAECNVKTPPKMWALNNLRGGDVTSAILNLAEGRRSYDRDLRKWEGYCRAKGRTIYQHVPDYEDNRRGFYRSLRKLVKDLKKAGI